jgi:osomolarity two-component system sensor histidine kinase NIK1
MSLKQLGNGTTTPTHCATCGRTTPVIAISDNVTTPPVFKSETEELHHLYMELQLLKDQVQDVARVCNAVARGDLSQKIAVPVQGVAMVQLKDIINTMVDKLGQFAKEVTRVSQEVGTEGLVRRSSDFTPVSDLFFLQQVGRTGAGSRCRRYTARVDRCSKQLGGQLDVSGNVLYPLL